ncbi:MAG: hypothetical protein AAFX87_06590 [Bacteroidota bacterium]
MKRKNILIILSVIVLGLYLGWVWVFGYPEMGLPTGLRLSVAVLRPKTGNSSYTTQVEVYFDDFAVTHA